MTRRLVSIQHVEIRWFKFDRGAEAGAVRNALPRAFPYDPPEDDALGWLQLVRMESEAAYAPRESWQTLPLRADRDGIRVQPAGEVAEVFLDPGAVDFYLQKPKRPHLSGLIARLPFGRRLTLRVNTAMDFRLQRLYAEHVFHVGYADRMTLDLPLFREIDERVILY